MAAGEVNAVKAQGGGIAVGRGGGGVSPDYGVSWR